MIIYIIPWTKAATSSILFRCRRKCASLSDFAASYTTPHRARMHARERRVATRSLRPEDAAAVVRPDIAWCCWWCCCRRCCRRCCRSVPLLYVCWLLVVEDIRYSAASPEQHRRTTHTRTQNAYGVLIFNRWSGEIVQVYGQVVSTQRISRPGVRAEHRAQPVW